jgi:hypothetical protein
MKALALLATTMLAMSLPLSAVSAQDLRVSGTLTNSASLPKRGTATYQGTFDIESAPWTGTTGPITITVDFGTGAVSAELTIPALGVGGPAPSPAYSFTPTGEINGKNKKASYTLTQGTPTSDDPFISITGTFTGSRGLNTQGMFVASFCVPEPTCPSGVLRHPTGTFFATRGSPPTER